jgi:pimeloyl-ACP methyl ester carboxylesterase
MAREMPHVDGVGHRFVEANGIRVHVAEAGPADADPLVLLHGWPQHWYAWRHLIGPLARSRRVLCPDLRGLGWTEAPPDGYEKEALADDLFALLEALEIERAGLIGHDWGGWIAFLAALREPDRVEAILALGIVAPMGRRPSLRGIAGAWRFWYQVVLASPLGERAAASLGSGRAASAVRWIGTDVWGEAERESFLGQFGEPERARASVQYYRTFQLRELPAIARGRYADAHLAVPARLLFGEKEPAMSPAMLEGAEDHADDLTVEILPGVGHFIPEQCPELVLDRARDLFGLPDGDGGDRPPG